MLTKNIYLCLDIPNICLTYIHCLPLFSKNIHAFPLLKLSDSDCTVALQECRLLLCTQATSELTVGVKKVDRSNLTCKFSNSKVTLKLN